MGTTAPFRQTRGITIVADFLRPDGQGRPGGADRPAAWLYHAIKRQIGIATGLPVRLLSSATEPVLAAWVTAQRTPEQADTVWSAAYAELPPDAAWQSAIERLVVAPLLDQFCVGYELPPYLVGLLSRHAIPYIDVRLHPVRFMDDLMFAVRATHPATHAAIFGIAVAEAEVLITAGLREATCRLISDAAVPAGTLLVIGQRPYNSSQIVGGRFFDAMDHRAEIAAICARHRSLMLKPHPHDREHSLLTLASGIGGNMLGVTDDNIYRLLAIPEISTILTVSSSVAYEAAYFGKEICTLAPLPIRLGWHGCEPSSDIHASLDDVMLSIDFWRMVLEPHTPVTARDGVRLAPKPNRLRIALDSFWNFNEIDTDRVPARAA